MYSIVLFSEENCIEGVPTSWLKKIDSTMFCFWPKKTPQNGITSFIKKCSEPQSNWGLVQCIVKKTAINYEEMRLKCKECEIVSTTENEEKSNSEHSDSDGESTDFSLPSPPRKKIKVTRNEMPVSGTIIKQDEIKPLLLEVVKMVKDIAEHVKSNSAAIDTVEKEVIDTKEEVKLVKKLVKRNTTAGNVSAWNANVVAPSKLPNLPVSSLEELENLETIIADDMEAKNLSQKLSNFGVDQLRSTVNNIMKKSISSNVAILYTFQGKTKKKSFINLKLCKCIQGNGSI